METQTTEWKRKWRDEFMKGICGLANVQGGTLDIGRDNESNIIGVENVR
jgi:ATP-dependent DNA helicase RecG